ncbi:MAG: histidinol dehydrogenase [Gammaproteobacteria bacterium]|jgi:histidinol dehydrogenase
MTVNLKYLKFSDAGFRKALDVHLTVQTNLDDELTQTVIDILKDVRNRGDEALIEYTNRFDRRQASIEDLEVPGEAIQSALNEIPGAIRDELQKAAKRIRSYHEHQRLESWSYHDEDGTLLGQKVTPLDSVGVYVPGGKAAYPSSVLMNTLPAKIAGVEKIIMVVPAPDGEINPLVLAAASIAQVDRVFSIGGAQAIAALAYGTNSVPAVDKIVGPGNRYVAAAKRQVFGTVGIDMIAGPSEVLIVSDGKNNPDWIAMDMFAQAEHDEDARAILISTEASFIDAVKESVNRLLPEMERREIIGKSLSNNGILILVKDLAEAADLVNHIAPEHLELAVSEPEKMLGLIKHAGAIFMGKYTAEVLGDYCAGPNHVLPTARTARFSSPLGVYDFQKRSSLIMCSEASAAALASTASILAYGEGLTAHARSAELRKKD